MVQKVVVLTGAGISAESGLKTFRDADGLWEGHRVEEVATPEAFEQNPRLVHEFYNARRAQHEGRDGGPGVFPNLAHRALAEFEAEFSGEFTLITQNVDALHQRAGSKNLFAMHGELLKARCVGCGVILPWEDDLSTEMACPSCSAAGKLRPHIVWFGEMPFYLDEIDAALLEADLFISIGTSGNVYPAAGFFRRAQAAGASTVELNLEPSLGAVAFAEVHYGPATQVVPDFFRTLLASVK